MGRKISRETAMKLLYQLEIQRDDKEEQIASVLEENSFSDKDRAYVTEVIDGVHKNLEFIDGIIKKYSKGWKLNRISKVDLSVLRLSIYEILFRDDIPLNVSINEAVELAKKYSSKEAGSFVNGILGKISELKTPAQAENSVDKHADS